MSVVSIRPLRRIRAGEWESRDGRFTFLSGRSAGAAGANYGAWHIYEKGVNEAWGDREPTLGEAVQAVQSAIDRGLM